MSLTKNWNMMYKTSEYRRCWDCRVQSPELAAIIASGIVRSKARVLDVGCGSGSDAIFLAAMGFDTTAIDISEEAIRIARKRAAEAGVVVEWLTGDVLKLPFGDHGFDFVNDRGCFHHIAPEHRAAYAAEMDRILGASGLLLVVGSSSRQMFVPVDDTTVQMTFSSRFDYDRVVPFRMISDNLELDANMVVLRRKAK